MKKLLLLTIFSNCWIVLPAQLSCGTTGLLHAPSADMQKDKTVMLDGNFLHQEFMPPKFNFNTWSYYLNVTILSFPEVAYTCTLFTTESFGLDKHGYPGFTSRDCYFSTRLCVLEESKYIPVVALGTSDPFTLSGHKFTSAIGNGYFCRYYLIATKHLQLGRGTSGVHLFYLYNRREDYPLNSVVGGIAYNPSFVPYLNIMAGYDLKDLIMGATYLLFNHIYFQFGLQWTKHFSSGLCYKIYLR